MTASEREVEMSERARSWPFDAVLIANRGEIAARIQRTVQACGLKSIVAYHAIDRCTPAVASADEAIEIRGSSPVAAYLDGQQLLDVARRAGARAVHPGYGFLAENAVFARAIESAGLTFVGPVPDQIELMGDKVRARAFVAERGFPVAPSEVEDTDPDSFVERAHRLGAPLLIKPAAGGGGKGMRIVRDVKLLQSEIDRARSEGLRYFGDGRLYAERFVDNPHHIEVQVLGDGYGNVVHMFERECSVQRRFQKIVEESPSPLLDDNLRQRICETAANIARAAGYRNAGTVEFIFGCGVFYFLEMNTRLQVEHPVTEQVTGRDLVFEQLRIAAGERLGYAQSDIKSNGHAIELRIYAEDPARGYTPTTGRVLTLREPVGTGVRVDSGIREGHEITTAFDPMLAKVIVTARNREEAISRARHALGEYVLLGCKTNTGFLRRLLAHRDFESASIHTGYLDANPQVAAEPELSEEALQRLLAVAALSTRVVRNSADAIPDLHAAMGGWRN